MEILSALQALHSQGLLHNTDTIYKLLMDMVPKFVGPHMVLYIQDLQQPRCILKSVTHCRFFGLFQSAVERAALVEILKLLVCLKSVSYEFVKMLLTLLAFKNLGLR